MIQELFGGGAAAGLISRERNISISGVLEASPSPTISPSSSTTTTTTTTASAAHAATSENQNLRCPRCDSSNTKFCYYNNYNLTQPRHFCKTCRRYWTKGGALRNVPIGGGCRKNKATTLATPVGKPISTGKLLKTVVSSEIGRSSFLSGFEHELSSNPILWPAPPQSSHLLALLRSATDQNPNPNPNPNFLTVKDEGSFMIGSNVMNNNLNSSDSAGNLGFDPLCQVPSVGLCSSFLRSSNQQSHHDHPNGGTYTPGIILNGEVHNSRNPYQRLRSSQANYSFHPEHTPVILGNVGSTSSSALSSTILESAPVSTGGEFGFWNPSLSWSDLPATNGAYP